MYNENESLKINYVTLCVNKCYRKQLRTFSSAFKLAEAQHIKYSVMQTYENNNNAFSGRLPLARGVLFLELYMFHLL